MGLAEIVEMDVEIAEMDAGEKRLLTMATVNNSNCRH